MREKQLRNKEKNEHILHTQNITTIPTQWIRYCGAYPRGAFHPKTFKHLYKLNCDEFLLDLNLLNHDEYIYHT